MENEKALKENKEHQKQKIDPPNQQEDPLSKHPGKTIKPINQNSDPIHSTQTQSNMQDMQLQDTIHQDRDQYEALKKAHASLQLQLEAKKKQAEEERHLKEAAQQQIEQVRMELMSIIDAKEEEIKTLLAQPSNHQNTGVEENQQLQKKLSSLNIFVNTEFDKRAQAQTEAQQSKETKLSDFGLLEKLCDIRQILGSAATCKMQQLDAMRKAGLLKKGSQTGTPTGQIGEWKYTGELDGQSRPCGQGTAVNQDGDKYEGTWFEGAWYGVGVLQNSLIGQSNQGEWKEGKQHGKTTWYTMNGRIINRICENGIEISSKQVTNTPNLAFYKDGKPLDHPDRAQ